MAQWSTRINQVIFAVLDVSCTMGLNSDKTSEVFCINITHDPASHLVTFITHDPPSHLVTFITHDPPSHLVTFITHNPASHLVTSHIGIGLVCVTCSAAHCANVVDDLAWWTSMLMRAILENKVRFSFVSFDLDTMPFFSVKWFYRHYVIFVIFRTP